VGTASKETIRKTLRGQTVPQRWENAQALFLVLCELAKIRPDEPRDDVDPWGTPTHEEHYRHLWNAALDEAGQPPYLSNGGGFSDEPPF
jgi:hypothetical protein